MCLLGIGCPGPGIVTSGRTPKLFGVFFPTEPTPPGWFNVIRPGSTHGLFSHFLFIPFKTRSSWRGCIPTRRAEALTLVLNPFSSFLPIPSLPPCPSHRNTLRTPCILIFYVQFSLFIPSGYTGAPGGVVRLTGPTLNQYFFISFWP